MPVDNLWGLKIYAKKAQKSRSPVLFFTTDGGTALPIQRSIKTIDLAAAPTELTQTFLCAFLPSGSAPKTPVGSPVTASGVTLYQPFKHYKSE